MGAHDNDVCTGPMGPDIWRRNEVDADPWAPEQRINLARWRVHQYRDIAIRKSEHRARVALG